MRCLYLLRHAKSSWSDAAASDAERPLAPRGRRAAERMAAHIHDADVRPSLVLCSSALRTRETLAAILPALGEAVVVVIDPSLYSASAAEIVDRVRAASDDVPSIMVIGHNPGMQELALSLATSGPALSAVREGFVTGALATLEFSGEHWRLLAPGTAELVGFVAPRGLD